MAYIPKTNWKKGEVLEADDMNRVEQGVSDVYTRLDTPKTNDLTLQPGTTTINANRAVPYNVQSLTGRLLLNLLGRAGNFDSTSGWTFTGGSGAVSTAQVAYGTNSLLFTLSATSGRIGRVVPTTVGSKYLVATEIRIGTATSANLNIQGGPIGNPVTTTAFQLSFALFTATSSSMDIGVGVIGASGQTVYVDGFRVYELSTSDYSAAGNMDRTGIAARWPYTEGLAGVRNPYAIVWKSTDKDAIKSMLVFQTELLASPIGTDVDGLTQAIDGQFYRTGYWRKAQINTTSSIVGVTNMSAYKRVAINGLYGSIKDSGYAVKFDSSVLPRIGQGKEFTSIDQHIITDSTDGSPNTLFVTINNQESGWGPDYSPNSDELTAFFLGWKLYDSSTNSADGLGVYTRTDGANKRWTPLASYDGSTYSGNVGTVPTAPPETAIPGGYRISRTVSRYEVMYRVALYKEAVRREGQLSFTEGENILETGSGMVVRERVKPFRDGVGWNINNGSVDSSGLGYSTSLTKYRIDRFIAIYRDNLRDQEWTLYGNTVTAAGALAQQSYEKYDSQAAYTVTYLPLDRYPSTSIIGNYPDSERAIFGGLIRDVQQLTNRVSVVESKKSDRDSPALIMPTLLNAWSPVSSFANGFKKIAGTNFVYFSFGVSGGAGAISTILTRLPAGYRPAKNVGFSVTSRNADSSAIITTGAEIRSTGDLVFATGAVQNGFLQVSGIFEAEG